MEKKEEHNAARLPRHIAVIMDGNGRWARQKNLPRSAGHRQGSAALRATIQACYELGIPYLTAYVFSTENWSRPAAEVSFLMQFFSRLLRPEVQKLHERRVRVNFLGDLAALPRNIQKQIREAVKLTQDNDRMVLNLMINYGGRAEITKACREIARDVQRGVLRLQKIDERVISEYLYTAGIPDPDMVIRTGGDLRISNFLIWQAAYAEIFVLDCYWPEFDREKLLTAIREFQSRERRYGGLK